MIVERFNQTVDAYPHRLAVKSGRGHITFSHLKRMAGVVAAGISEKEIAVALLFGRGEWMIASALGVLGSGNFYVPLDVSYPERRLVYMLEHSGATVLLTDNACFPLAETLASQVRGLECSIMNVETVPIDRDTNIPHRNLSPDRPAYILYTSGSTGTPKGVVQTNDGVCCVIDRWVRCFGITHMDHLTLLSSYSHDTGVMDLFSGLFSGAAMFPLDVRDLDSIEELPRWIEREQITVWHSVPTLFRYFLGVLSNVSVLPGLRVVVLGGEAVIRRDVELFGRLLPHASLRVAYGQSESSFNSFWSYEPGQPFKRVTLGETVDGVELLLVDDDGDILEDLGSGEIFVRCRHVAAGYWRDPEATGRVFLYDPELGRLYRTGDLGRMLPEGSIEFLGRKDFQVKIRGFRVELGEIESSLREHNGVKDAVVIARQLDNGESRLEGYVVLSTARADGNRAIDGKELLNHLRLLLPDYMVPSSITIIDDMPLTPSGKIDRRELRPAEATGENAGKLILPADDLQRRLAKIWARVLNIPEHTISIDVSFLRLGGHSLNAGQLAAAIHRDLEVKVPLAQIFETPTIQSLADVIRGLDKERFEPVTPSEKRDYYPLSPAQKRLLVMQRLAPESTQYNMPQFLPLDHTPELERLNHAFSQMIQRHESLRTTFCHVSDEPVQRVCPAMGFEVEVHPGRLPGNHDDSQLSTLMKAFVRPFDLAEAPLIRVKLVMMEGGGSMLMVDLHHIIADGNSLGLLQKEFTVLYNGGGLDSLKLQYRDYSLWQEAQRGKDGGWRQEHYWLERFTDEIPPLELPVDHELEDGDFSGNMLRFSIEEPLLRGLRNVAETADVTMSMLLMAMYSALLSRISGQEDLVVGIPVAGRGHADLQGIIGMFVNLLPIRSFPNSAKPFDVFLNEVRRVSLAAYENQDYPFEELIRRLGLSGRDADNPLVQTVFVYAYEDIAVTDPGARTADSAHLVAKFPLTLGAAETRHRMFLDLEYRTGMFHRSTIEQLKRHLLALAEAVADDPSTIIAEIELEGRERSVGGATTLEAEFGF